MSASKPTLDIFTGPKGLGTVILEQIQLNTKFSDFTLPLSTETGNTAINWKGRVRTIVLQGFHDGVNFDGATDNDKLGDFIYEMEQWVTAAGETLNIQASAVFTDSFGTTYNVKCYDWTWARSVTDPYRVNYSLLLKVV